jgi:hypothetical protein
MALLEAVQHIRRMRGGSQSHLMRASDGNFYIVKFRNNPQATRVLANEFIASQIGKILGLPVPDVAMLDVCEWLIQHTPELHVENAGLRSPLTPGIHLGIRFVANPLDDLVFDYLPEHLCRNLKNLTDFPRILVLDKWLSNADGRQAVFTKTRSQTKYRATFIDQGYCFNAGEWTFPDLTLQGVFYRNFVYEHVRGWDDFEPALSLAESMSFSQIAWAADQIPREWWAKHEYDNSLKQLLDSLFTRRSIIRDRITAFRESTRNPFPNWN